MKKYFSLLLLLFLIVNANSQVHYITINGQTREYYLYLPDSLSSDTPLVFALHGYSGSAVSMRNYTGFNQIAENNGFVVCYPQGLTDQWGNSFWNVGYDFHQNETVDDVEFLTVLAQYLQNEYNLNAQNTFCTGMSNGGDMCYLLACQAPGIFKAVAPVAGCMMEWIYSSCNPSNPIPVLEIHGTDDDITYWNGDMNNTQGYGAYLPVLTTFDFWIQLNECTQSVIDTFPDINLSDGSIVISEKFTDGINNNEVWLYKVEGGGHDWPGSSGNIDINASEEIWNFFDQSIQNNILNVSKNRMWYSFELYQNYPNPFNPNTTINFSIPKSSFVALKIYDVLGSEIVTLVNEEKPVGSYEIEWNASALPSGIYFYRLQVYAPGRAGSFFETKKMILLK
jgi:polyhydroxybutyrate depolymerase